MKQTYRGRGILYPFLLLICLMLGFPLWATADWTILVYMAADNGLSTYAVQDINQMESANLPSGTNVIVQADFNEYTEQSGAYRYRIVQDESALVTSPTLANLGEIDSGSPQTLQDFIEWGFHRYPANHKALIIWSHGDSWYKGLDYKWICPDNVSESIMSVSEGDLREALSGCPRLDVLLFDACSMQTLEVLSEVSESADYVVGSEDLVPATGFPYQDILPIWQGDALGIMQQLPEIYVNSYVPYGSQNPFGYTIKATCSVFQTSYLNNFIYGMGSFSGNEASTISGLLEARAHCYNLNTYDAEVDVKEMLEYLAAHGDNSYLIEDANYKLERLSQFVIAKAAINYSREVGTASLWFPTEENTFQNWWTYYIQLPRMSNWLKRVYSCFPEPIVALQKPVIDSAVLTFDRLALNVRIMPYPDNLILYRRFVGDNPNYSFDPRPFDDYYFSPSINHTFSTSLFHYYFSGWLYLFVKDSRGYVSAEDSVRVECVDTPNRLIISPNPVRGNQSITFEWLGSPPNQGKSSGDEVLRIFDIKGRDLNMEPYGIWNANTDHYVCTIDLRQLPSGIYIVVAKRNGKDFKAKFTVIK